MNRPAVHQDAALLIKNLVKDMLDHAGETATTGIGLPDHWTPADGDHVQIDTDGGPDRTAAAWHTIRITAWSAGRSRAVELANITRALLLTHDGSGGIQRPRPGTLVLTDRDDRTSAYIASATVIAPIRARYL